VNYSNFEPLHDRVLLKVLPQSKADDATKTAGGLYIPTTRTVMNPMNEAIVMAVGPGEVLAGGGARSCAVSVGDRVLVYAEDVAFLEAVGDPGTPRVGLIGDKAIQVRTGRES